MAAAAGYVQIRVRRQRKIWGRPVGDGYRRLGSLGDTCWVTTGGQRVCGAGDPTAQTTTPVCLNPSVPQNNGNGPAVAPDRTTWQFTQSGTSLVGNPKSHNLRRYQFKYHSGLSDVYAQVGGGSCSGFSCAYVIVGPGGVITFAAAPPAPSEPPCSNGNTGTPTTSGSSCYTDPISGATVCGQGAALTYPTQNNVYPYPVGYSSGYPYSPIQTDTGTGYSMATPTAAAAAPAGSSGGAFSNIPTWALVGGGVAGGLLLMKVLKR